MKKSFIYRFINHFKTITKHTILVCKYCFKLGLYKQGIMHDLSKYTPTEFIPGVKYFQGNRSPIDKEKELYGFSDAWLHHKGRNKHHWEYWYDFTSTGYGPLEMPLEYVCEMICDRVSACRTYLKEDYKDDSALIYFTSRLSGTPMHPKTEKLIHKLLSYIKDYGEEEGFKKIKEYLKENI